jgi:cytochrome c-type biogenesis protein CcmH
MRRLACLIYLLLACAGAAVPVPAIAQSSEIVTPDQPLADPVLEARARRLMKEIRCVVCQSQSIDESEAGIAHDMRQIVRSQIADGRSDAEIRTYLTDRYGDFVLLKPPFKAATLVLWLGPFALALIAGLGVFLFYRRPSTVAAAALSPAERARVAAFLKQGPGEDSASDTSGSGGQP